MSNPERKQLVEEWHNGNENMAAFCRSKELNYQTFRLWVKRFEEETQPSSASKSPPLVKLEIPTMPESSATRTSSIEIHIGQFRVMIPAGSFNMEKLEGIMNILRKLAV